MNGTDRDEMVKANRDEMVKANRSGKWVGARAVLAKTLRERCHLNEGESAIVFAENSPNSYKLVIGGFLQ